MIKEVKAVKIRVIGIVQGVGFRPFVYRLATKLGLKGYVINLGGSEVEIHVEGPREGVDEFLVRLERDKPPNAKIFKVMVEEFHPQGYQDFRILESITSYSVRSVIPPDIAICGDCIREIRDQNSRFFRYPWNSCAWCGPRFSMMYRTPYDRINTSMVVFELCENCLKSYRDPEDTRRFHGQGISCPICGPRTYVYSIDGTKLDVKDPVSFVAEKILEGSIVAIKGVGGYHIACLASDDEVVMKLRVRKKRPYQPFALMARDFSVVESIAVPPPGARELLESPQRPIVIMPKRTGSKVSELVAPGLSTIGVMLPYTGFQVLLLDEIPEGFLVMTSGNIHGEPMCKDIVCVFNELKDVVDYVVEHERAIVHRVDDSVIRFTNGRPVFLRRGRGYAPEWIEIPIDIPDSIALGAEQQTAAAVGFENKVVLTQFIGDLDNPKALSELRAEVKWFTEAYKLEPKIIAIDMHPLYHNRKIAVELSKEFGAEIVEVQHHHAHVIATLAEHGIDPRSRVVAIAIDGTGYGLDGGIWGGEILLTTYKNFDRVGSLRPFTLPGGDSAALYPAKVLISLLASAGFTEEEVIDLLTRRGLLSSLSYGYEEAVITYTLSIRGRGIVATSIGRVLDAFSALLGVCTIRTYEGEPPIRLESLADRGKKVLDYEPKLKHFDGRVVVDEQDLLLWAVESVDRYDVEDVALTVLKSIGRGLGLAAVGCLRGLRDVEQFVVLGGGAAVNTYIVQGVEEVLREEDLKLIMPRKLPPGDGGIALGQVVIAAEAVKYA